MKHLFSLNCFRFLSRRDKNGTNGNVILIYFNFESVLKTLNLKILNSIRKVRQNGKKPLMGASVRRTLEISNQ